MNFYTELKIDLIAGAISAIVIIVWGIVAYRKSVLKNNQ